MGSHALRLGVGKTASRFQRSATIKLAGLLISVPALLFANSSGAELRYAFTYIDNSFSDFAQRGWLNEQSDFQRNIRAAAALWSEHVDGDVTLNVQVEADRAVVRAGGTFSLGRLLGTDDEGRQVFEPGPLTRILTGSNPGGPVDMFLSFNASFVEENYFFDPQPGMRMAPVPLGMTDFVSIVLHEMGHGFGINGFRSFAGDATFGEFVSDVITNYDELTFYDGDGEPRGNSGQLNNMFFAGARAGDVFGGPVPLAFLEPSEPLFTQNYYHLGTCGDPPLVENSLMNGCSVPVDGSRLFITPVDVQVLVDLGYINLQPPRSRAERRNQLRRNDRDELRRDIRRMILERSR